MKIVRLFLILFKLCNDPYLWKLSFFFIKVPWGSKILSIAGHTKDPSETVTGCINIISFYCSFIYSHEFD